MEQSKIEAFVKDYEEIKELIEDTAEKVFKIKNPKISADLDGGFSIEDGYINQSFEEYYGCGSDYHSVNFPVECLWDESAIDKIREEEKEKLSILERKKLERKEQDEIRERKKRAEQYEKLREEFEQ